MVNNVLVYNTVHTPVLVSKQFSLQSVSLSKFKCPWLALFCFVLLGVFCLFVCFVCFVLVVFFLLPVYISHHLFFTVSLVPPYNSSYCCLCLLLRITGAVLQLELIAFAHTN